jgi:hypothetical protein
MEIKLKKDEITVDERLDYNVKIPYTLMSKLLDYLYFDTREVKYDCYGYVTSIDNLPAPILQLLETFADFKKKEEEYTATIKINMSASTADEVSAKLWDALSGYGPHITVDKREE